MTARRRLLAPLLAPVFLLAAAAACGDPTLEPLPLDVLIQPSRTTAAPGETINFVVDVQGGNLVGVDVDYGDTAVERYSTGGARRGHIVFRHAYSAAGTYTVRATVTDASAGTKEATVDVQVQ